MSKNQDEECIICLENNIDNFQIKKNCNCTFLIHKKCLDSWLNKNNECPICRKKINPILEPIVQDNGNIIIYNSHSINIPINNTVTNIPIKRKLYLKKIFLFIIGFILLVSFIVIFL